MSQQNDYTLLFAQRQEQLFIEYVRKSIDLDVKLQITSMAKEELEKQLEDLRNLFDQATFSLQTLTVENKNYERKIEKLEPDLGNAISEKNQYIKELNSVNLKLENLQKEYDRQCIEMNNIFADKKAINKKKAVGNSPNETMPTVEEDNIF